MADQNDVSATDGVEVDTLERYGDRDRPPAPWVYPVVGLGLGGAVALAPFLPSPWAIGVGALAVAAALGVDGRLAHRDGLPRLRQLPAPIRREQQALIVGTGAVAVVALVLAGLLDGVSTRVAFILAGAVLAVGLGIGGPIVDRRARARARELVR